MLDPINVKYFKFAVGSDIGKESPNDISAKCNICGDSDTDKRQKRLHLYRKTSYDQDAINCFNCGFKGNMYSYLKECNQILFEQYKKEKQETSFNHLKQKHAQEEPEDFEFSYQYKKKKPIFTFKFPDEFMSAEEDESAKEYLLGRELSPDGLYFSNDSIELNGAFIPVKNSIIIPLWYNENDKIAYGFQARSMKEKRFYTYIPEENTGYKVWNWFGVDKTKPTFIFESVFDALSSGLPNDRVVAALGCDLNGDRISELSEAIFCLDNQFKDNTSKEKSIELLESGFRVFVWPVSIEEKDTNSWLQNSKNKKQIAFNILSNLMSGSKGILKIKLGKRIH